MPFFSSFLASYSFSFLFFIIIPVVIIIYYLLTIIIINSLVIKLIK